MEGGLWCGAVFQELGSVSSSERNCYCFSIPKHFGQFHAPNIVGTVWAWGFLFQLECALVHKVRSVKALLSEFVVEKLDWPVQSPDLNPTQHLWNELETLLNLVESLPRRVEAVSASKGGPTSY